MNKLEINLSSNPEFKKAKDFFNPVRFGFKDMSYKEEHGWEKQFDNDKLGLVTFAPLTSVHMRIPAISQLLSQMQERIFGIDTMTDILPSHALGKTHCMVAYKSEQFTKEGALGLSVVFGGKTANGELSSKAIGIMPEYQGLDLGWYLRILQANMALENGFTTIDWSFNPAREPNAKLFIAKLGGNGTVFTPKKPGMLDSGKGTPSDKVTITWDLLSENVHEKIQNVYSCIVNHKSYSGLSLANFDKVDIVNLQNLDNVIKQKPQKILYQLSNDHNFLSDDTEETLGEKELRKVFSTLLDTTDANYPQNSATNPSEVKEFTTSGEYSITDLITDYSEGKKKIYYVFSHK